MASSVASQNWEGGEMFDFRRATVFFLGRRFPKHNMTRYTKKLGGMAPGYVCE